jgi:hypothetical protein
MPLIVPVGASKTRSNIYNLCHKFEYPRIADRMLIRKKQLKKLLGSLVDTSPRRIDFAMLLAYTV